MASAAVLILWNYLFPPAKPSQPNANSQQTAQASPQPSAQSSVSTTPTPAQAASSPLATPAATPDTVPQRKVRIVTPLYEATFDTRGAVATSWIIKKNKSTGDPFYAASSNKKTQNPLELIPAPPPGISPDQLYRSLQIVTDDAALSTVLSNRNFKSSDTISGTADQTVEVSSGSQQINFTLHDDAIGLDVAKTITFFADRYTAEVQLKITQHGQQLPENKKASLAIGPSIGDQGIEHHSFYAVAPEGIAIVDGKSQRFPAEPIHKNAGGWFSSPRPEGADLQKVGGAIQWAGVGDTYFGMIAVPASPVSGLEFRTVAYEQKTSDKPEPRYLITGLLPVRADGSKIELYVGPKDHRLLATASEEIKQAGPQVDLGEAINYGFLSSMRRFLAVPILFSINALQRLTGSYGIAIILFTIFIYSLFFPLKWQSSRKMKKAQKYAPRMKELQEKLKGMKSTDPRMKELQMEQLRLMKEANPLGGCLPLLIQMPFLFALYSAITISIDFRQATFLWIPDLSGPEPYIFGVVRILPILFAASMITLQLLTPQPSADPLQRKMMAVGMPLFMLYILWSAPAGLLLYWLVGNIVGFVQQFMINKLTKEETPPPDAKDAKKKPPKNLKPAEA